MNPFASFCTETARRALPAALVLLLAGTPASAGEPPPASPKGTDTRLPGIALSQGVTEITGVAISPLLGVSAVGAWRYATSPQDQRKLLPWYASPWFWGSGLAIVALCFLKDSLGTAVPGLLKKPFDVLELFENKASALLAAGTFVPLVASEMAASLDDGKAAAIPAGSIAGPTMVFVDPSWWMVPASLTAFTLVWLCSHAIHVLIILSPFSTLDALLKLLKAVLLGGIALVYALAPWIAALLCLALIAAAAWMAPSALRMLILGTRVSSDLLLRGSARNNARHDSPHAVCLGSFAGVPPRSSGRISMNPEGVRVFSYRRWIVTGTRSVPLPSGTVLVRKGLIAPSLSIRTETGERCFLLLPRHRGSEEAVAAALKADSVKEHPVKQGLAVMISWFRNLGNPAPGDNRPG
jgi:hypothetical protein